MTSHRNRNGTPTDEYYNNWGAQEEERLTTTARGMVNLEMHLRALAEIVGEDLTGKTVLEIGAGTGIFTRELLRRGARVTVTDVSTKQLEENQKRTEATIAEHN